jgi:ATP-dependent Clp protease ATP-binding subunit ClpA
MFERFTAEARRVVVLSREEAAWLHHDYVGSEHILLGLLGQPDGLAFSVLGRFGLSLEGIREEVAGIHDPGETEPGGRIRFNPRARKTLELAAREALALRHDYIGTEHILLGVIRGDGAGAQIVNQHADLAAVRRAVLDLMPAGTEDTRTLAWLRIRDGMNRGDPGSAGQVLRVTPAADATLTEAARLADSKPAGSHHLLLAALADPGTAAARALAALGVDLGQAREALRSVDIADTGDEQSEEAWRRQAASRVSDDLAAIEEVDPTFDEATYAALQAIADKAGPPPARQRPR